MSCQKIARLPRSSEKRVISFSLFGNDSRYIKGAFQNLELLDIYFPGGFSLYAAHSEPQFADVSPIY